MCSARGPFRFVEHVAGFALGGRAVSQGLLQAGLAPISMAFRACLHAGCRADQCSAGRADHGGLPQRDDGGSRSARCGARRQDHRAGESMAQRTAGDLQHGRKKTVRRSARAPARWSLAIDRWRASEVLARLLDHALCRRLSAAGLRPSLAREEDLVKMPGFGREHWRRAGPRRSASSPKRAVTNLKVRFGQSHPDQPVSAGPAVFRDRSMAARSVSRSSTCRANDLLYNNSMNDGTFRCRDRFPGRLHRPSRPINSAATSPSRFRPIAEKYTDRGARQIVRPCRRPRPTRKKRYDLLRQFEMRMLTEGLHRAAALVAADSSRCAQASKAGA